MSDGPRYRVAFRRRREGKTDYRYRLKLLKSGTPRAVVRLSGNRVIVSLTGYDPKGDRVLAAAESPELGRIGFPESSFTSTTASYLTGYLAGLRAKGVGANEAVLDVGLRHPSQGGRLLGALKGLLDAGVEIPHGEGAFPSNDRLNGKHLPKPLPKPLDQYRTALGTIVARGEAPA
jgi:large subunit ribosomal protein L18